MGVMSHLPTYKAWNVPNHQLRGKNTGSLALQTEETPMPGKGLRSTLIARSPERRCTAASSTQYKPN